MARYTVDANVVIDWLMSRVTAAEAFFTALSREDELVLPPMLLPECTSVLREEVFDRRLQHEEAQALLATPLSLPLTLFDGPQQLSRALDLARRFDHRKAYDIQNVAVAELEKATLVTGDGGPSHAAREAGVPVSMIR